MHALLSRSGGHGWGLAVFPLLAGVIALVFGLQLTQRFFRRRRSYEGIWALALFMYAAASFAMFDGVVAGWSSLEFRVYWLFGAVLNVPFLFMGELYLLFRKRVLVNVILLALLAASAFAAWKVWVAPIHPVPLMGSLPLGKDAFGDRSLPYRLAQFYSIPAYILLLGGLVWSSIGMRSDPALRGRTVGTLGIAFGATIVAIGSGIGAAFHVVPLFSVSLAGGVAVMFWGFVQASRPASKNQVSSTSLRTPD